MSDLSRLRVTNAPQPAGARSFVRDALEHWDGPQVIDDAELLVSELVTNAIRHADAQQVAVGLAIHDDRVWIGVHDSSHTEPSMRDLSCEGVGGYGMNLVDRLSVGWGVDQDVGGKTVWFELVACRCS